MEFTEISPVVHIEDQTSVLFLERPDTVAAYRRNVAALGRVALDEGQSRTWLASLASELGEPREEHHAHRPAGIYELEEKLHGVIPTSAWSWPGRRRVGLFATRRTRPAPFSCSASQAWPAWSPTRRPAPSISSPTSAAGRASNECAKANLSITGVEDAGGPLISCYRPAPTVLGGDGALRPSCPQGPGASVSSREPSGSRPPRWPTPRRAARRRPPAGRPSAAR